MSGDARTLDAKRARKRLGLKPGADAAALSAAFREAARRTHPDREGGDAAAFREVLEAYRFLRRDRPDPIVFIPVPAPPRQEQVEISARTAIFGGEAMAATADGRRLKLRLKPGLRPGQIVRAGTATFMVAVRDEGVIVRGDDIWISHAVDVSVLSEGGRLTVDTPCGRRCFWINRKTAARRLVRLPGDGLPAAGARKQGDLFIRLTVGETAAESPARILLRRFAAAWAA